MVVSLILSLVKPTFFLVFSILITKIENLIKTDMRVRNFNQMRPFCATLRLRSPLDDRSVQLSFRYHPLTVVSQYPASYDAGASHWTITAGDFFCAARNTFSKGSRVFHLRKPPPCSKSEHNKGGAFL